MISVVPIEGRAGKVRLAQLASAAPWIGTFHANLTILVRVWQKCSLWQTASRCKEKAYVGLRQGIKNIY